MKNISISKITLFFGALLLTWGLLFSLVQAEVRQGDKVSVGSDEVIDDDLFTAANDININGSVTGDVYAGGNTVNVAGNIRGDLIAGAETISITGKVDSHIRVAGRSLTLTGSEVGDNLMFFGEELRIDKDSKINGNIIFFGKTLIVDGVVDGNIRGAVKSAVIAGEIDGSMEFYSVESLDLKEGAIVKGDVEYTSENKIKTSEGAIIEGEVVYHDKLTKSSEREFFHFNPFYSIWSFLAIFIVGIVMLSIFPRPTVALAHRITARPLRTLAVGALTMLAVFVVIPLILITVVGIPLALILLALFFISLYVAKVYTATALGLLLLRNVNRDQKNPNPYLGLGLGLVIFYLIFLLPIVGELAGLVITLLGLGALVYGVGRARRI